MKVQISRLWICSRITEAALPIEPPRAYLNRRSAAWLRKPQSFVAKYENGERRLKYCEFLEVAAALGIDGHALLRTRSKR
jgi:hypothetical protein